MDSVFKTVANFSAAVVLDHKQGPPKATEVIKWRRPSQGFVKLNVDASLSPGLGCGIGVIARDETGRMIIAAAKRVQDANNIEWWRRIVSFGRWKLVSREAS